MVVDQKGPEFHGRVCDLPAITFRLTRRNHEEKLWNYLVKVILERHELIRHCIQVLSKRVLSSLFYNQVCAFAFTVGITKYL
jgi:hypothetical protein